MTTFEAEILMLNPEDMNSINKITFATTLFLLCFSFNVNANVFNVTNTNDAGVGSLRAAIISANSDNSATAASPHIIDFSSLGAGIHIITLSSRISINENIHIVGLGIDNLIIESNMSDRIFEVNPASIISDCTLRNGKTGSSGGGLTVESPGALTLTNVKFINNMGENGGAIRAGDNTELNISGCIFDSNISTDKGGALNIGGDGYHHATIINTFFRGNTATAHGGAIFIDKGNLEMYNCVISGNMATQRGGGIYNNDRDSLNIIGNCTISGNMAGQHGGGIHNDGNITLQNTIVALNSATGMGPDMYTERPAGSNGGNLLGINTDAEGSFPSGNPNNNQDLAGTSIAPIDPQFTMNVPVALPSVGGDLTFYLGSPAFEAGLDANAPPHTMIDILGNPRTANDHIEIGAFEIFIENIPTLTQWGILILGLTMLVIGIVAFKVKNWTLSV